MLHLFVITPIEELNENGLRVKQEHIDIYYTEAIL